MYIMYHTSIDQAANDIKTAGEKVTKKYESTFYLKQ